MDIRTEPTFRTRYREERPQRERRWQRKKSDNRRRQKPEQIPEDGRPHIDEYA